MLYIPFAHKLKLSGNIMVWQNQETKPSPFTIQVFSGILPGTSSPMHSKPVRRRRPIYPCRRAPSFLYPLEGGKRRVRPPSYDQRRI